MEGILAAWLTLAFFVFAAGLTVRQAAAELRLPPGGLSAAARIQADPRASDAWIELGLEAESSGDLRTAEVDLRRAADADHQYLPAWTLANFYFRRHDANAFWPWAARAARLAYDDLEPLLRLCDAMEPDPGIVLDTLNRAALPGSTGIAENRAGPARDRAAVRQAYLDFLIGEGRLEATQAIAKRMLEAPQPGDASRLDGLIDREIAQGETRDALEIWERLHPGPVLYGTRSPEGTTLLAGIVNGDFRTMPSGSGFDWRLTRSEDPAEGLAEHWIPAGGGSPGQLDIEFSGDESEACLLLEQELAQEPRSPAGPSRLEEHETQKDGPAITKSGDPRLGANYRLSFEYATLGMPSPTGVRWTLGESPDDRLTLGDIKDAAESPVLEPSEPWREASWIISRISLSGKMPLLLLYRRDAGTVRAKGRLSLRKIRLEAL